MSSWFSRSLSSDLTAFAVEDEAVGPVPSLDDVEAFSGFTPQRFECRYRTPLIYSHVTPYGTFRLDMNQRLAIEQDAVAA